MTKTNRLTYKKAKTEILKSEEGVIFAVTVLVIFTAILYNLFSTLEPLNPKVTAEIKAELPGYITEWAHDETLPLSQVEHLDIVFQQSYFCPVFEAHIKIKNIASTIAYEDDNDFPNCMDNAPVGYELSIDKNGELIINIDDELPDDTQRPTERLNQIAAIKNHILNAITKTLIFSQREKSSLEKLKKYE